MKPRLIRQLGLSSRIMPFLLTPLLTMLPNQKAQAFCNQDTPFGILQCPGNTGGHKDITKNGMNFLRPTIFDDIVDEHIFQDTANSGKDFIHFDNSRFVEGVNYINTQYTDSRNRFGAGGVVAELDPTSPQPFDATDEFGQLLHTAQDFYSHSNWVDYDPTNVPLFDKGTGLWTIPTPYRIVNRGTTKLIVVQGAPLPAGVTVAPAIIPSPPSPTIPLTRGVSVTVAPGALIPVPAGAYNGLVSGFFSLPDKLSGGTLPLPPDAPLRHGYDNANLATDPLTLNKDERGRTNYPSAFDAAVKQTENEWCRLLNLTKTTHGLAGASIPMALFVDPSGSPHPKSTTCFDDTQATQSVKVTINNIKVLNDTDPLGAGKLNFPFVLYTNDFTRSVRTETNSISVSSRASVPPASRPSPLTLSLNDPNKLVITLQAWDDDRGSDGVFDNTVVDPDDVLEGITVNFPGGFSPFKAKKFGSKDLEVCLTAELLPGANRQAFDLSSSDSDSSTASGCLDYGDAPDSYRTLFTSDGPRYLEGDFQRLGSEWDDEADGQPTLKANGDDLSAGCDCTFVVDDEDGVIFGDTWVDVLFTLTRPKEEKYNLSVWWDLNENKFFDHPTERKIFDDFTITDLLLLDPEKNLYKKHYNLGFDPRKYYSRFRLTWEPSKEVLPWGEVLSKDGISHGEVEDYAPIPEPSSVLGIFAVTGLGLRGIRKKRQQAVKN